MSTEIPITSSEEYRRYLKESVGFPPKLVDAVDEVAQFAVSVRDGIMLLASATADVSVEYVTTLYEYKDDPESARIWRSKTIEGRERQREMFGRDYLDMEVYLHMLVATTREAFSGTFPENGMKPLGHANVLADIKLKEQG